METVGTRKMATLLITWNGDTLVKMPVVFSVPNHRPVFAPLSHAHPVREASKKEEKEEPATKNREKVTPATDVSVKEIPGGQKLQFIVTLNSTLKKDFTVDLDNKWESIECYAPLKLTLVVKSNKTQQMLVKLPDTWLQNIKELDILEIYPSVDILKLLSRAPTVTSLSYHMKKRENVVSIMDKMPSVRRLSITGCIFNSSNTVDKIIEKSVSSSTGIERLHMIDNYGEFQIDDVCKLLHNANLANQCDIALDRVYGIYESIEKYLLQYTTDIKRSAIDFAGKSMFSYFFYTRRGIRIRFSFECIIPIESINAAVAALLAKNQKQPRRNNRNGNGGISIGQYYD